jgi:hypothetical protein
VPYYGVFMSNTTGALSGYAWAGDSPNYGWLSFNPSDLTGCPSSGSCTAQVNLTTGQVTGWAKFIGANGNLGAWDGWVSLSGSNNNGVSWGVTYSSSTGNFSGEAWGGDVVGWISFCDTASGNNYYCVTASPQAAVGVSAPIIIATSTGIDTSGQAWINVTWQNPISYKHVQIQISNANQSDINNKGLYRNIRRFDATNSTDAPYTAKTSANGVSYTISGLKASSTYGVFVRGYP